MEDNLKVISDVDRAFNEQDWDAFNNRHAETVVAYSPLTPEPTKGVDPHRESVQGLFRAFPDMTMKQELSFGQGDWVCAVYSLTGTQDGPFQGPGGKEIPPTNKPVEMSFCTALKIENEKIVEERVYFDVLGMMAQLGLAP
ncbi:MAG: ester cyclase [Thermoplasmata archaeon]